ncbi:hypothetical protein [Fredinandcohnia sp. 179-A 10B2 NHS]|uniref:hypothetical protein n=1 Tax=Fredinandcohnia sp. 179-A 10B2 NHS TaxID=3235176 RepID=UPI00399FD6E8
MAVYEFIACDQKLTSFEDALADEEVKSYNELLSMGYTEEQIHIRGIDLTNIDRDKKVFLIQIPEELQNSPLVIEEDFHHSYARYLTDKKFIYKVAGADKVVSHLAGYIGKYSNTWTELELWRVLEDDYSVDSSEIPQSVINLRNLSLENLEEFYEGSVPRILILFHK